MYYCTVHVEEDQIALVGEDLDACNAHMVIHSGYDLNEMREALPESQVIWQMERSSTAKFGWKFSHPVL